MTGSQQSERRSQGRVPTMLSLDDVASLIHAVAETSIAERPAPGTTTKLATALRRLDPERRCEQTWDEIEEIRGR